MFSTMLSAIAIIIGVGLVSKLILDTQKRNDLCISWLEFTVIVIISCFIITPIIVKIGWEEAKKNKLQYEQYLNGWETNTTVENTPCQKNGSCKQYYECDPHLVSYSCNCHESCSGSGSSKSCSTSCDTCYRTEYDECPYVDIEYDYIINTTLGDFLVDSHRFPENPQEHRWREHKEIPDEVIERAGVGAPERWKIVHERLVSGRSGPVTVMDSYKNMIYASDSTILKQFSNEVDKYKKLGLLPRLSTGIRDLYLADKVYWVKINTPDKNLWNERMNYLNSAVGYELQGDIHLVIIDSSNITDPEEYSLALRSYWQNKVEFGKHALPKNTIVIILGTDSKTISWAKGFTGMPLGNEEVIQGLSNLKGEVFNVENILGNVQRIRDESGKDWNITHSLGLIENILYGFKDKSIKFKRISMDKKDSWDIGTGFKYLMSEIQPNKGTKITCLILCVILSCIGWVITAMTDLDTLIRDIINQRKRRL